MEDSLSQSFSLADGAKELPLSTLTCLLLFACNHVLFICVSLYSFFTAGRAEYSKLETREDAKPELKIKKKMVQVVQLNKASLMELSKEVFVFGNILFYIWVCENRPMYEHGSKSHWLDFFWFLSLGLIVVSSFTFHEDRKLTAILNRDQTEEWKGWMQVMFLLYHYFSVGEVYNLIRVMISCYVWMTGFGNLSFFYIKRDFGFVRFYQMMWRLNFLVFFLCMTLNNMYILYYICPLHTFYFLMTYAVMALKRDINHTKYGARIKLIGLGMIIFLVWEFLDVYELAFFWLPSTHHPGAAVGAYGIKYEWHFRSGLDHWSTFFGMIFALNFPQSTLWLEQVERLSLKQQVVAKGIPGLGLFMLCIYWCNYIVVLPKLEYNTVHPYTFMIPLLSYIYFRNITPRLRQVHMGLLAEIGKVTLETYLMQHHIWLTSNAKTLLVIIPGWPKVNMLIVSVAYVLISRRLYRTTITLRAMLIPNSLKGSLNSLFGLSFLFAFFTFTAWFLQWIAATWTVIALIIVILSFVVFKFASHMVNSHGRIKRIIFHEVTNRTLFKFYAVSIFTSMLALVLTSFQTGNVIAPDGPFRPPVVMAKGRQCLPYVNLYHTAVPDEACLKGSIYCEAARWEWNKNVPKSCKFHPRSPKETLALLSGRNIHFVGDESVYEVMFSLQNHLSQIDALRVERKATDKMVVVRIQADNGKFQPIVLRYTSAKDIKVVAKTLQALDRDTDLIIFGSWVNDAKAGLPPTVFGRTVTEIVQGDINKKYVWIQPQTIHEKIYEGRHNPFDAVQSFNATAYNYKKSVTIPENFPVVDMFKLTADREKECLDGITYSANVYAASSQILLNIFDKMVPARVAPSKSDKGSGGGIAHNPEYGMIIVAVATVMLFSMDSYGGITFISKYISGDKNTVTWEESVSQFHGQIGIPSPKQANVTLASGFKSDEP